MDASVYQEAFNNKLLEFLNDLICTFPEVHHDLKTLKHGVNMARNIDPQIPQTFFNERVASKYEDRILAKDDQFFLDHDYTLDLSGLDSKVQGFDLDIIGRLKAMWGNVNAANRETIWKYLHVLLALNKKCKFEM